MSKQLPHPVDEWLPWWKLGAYGFQHVLTFYAGAVIVPILLASALGLPRDILERLITADLYVDGKLDGIRIPTLITWGENDKTIPVAYGRDFAAHIPDSRLVVIPASGHVQPAEKPAEFAAAVEAFLAEHPLPDKP